MRQLRTTVTCIGGAVGPHCAGVPNTTIAPRSEWSEILFNATTEVFTMMVGGVITRAHQASPPCAQVTGTIGITGAVQATFSLRCSASTAARIASHMLALPIERAATQACDAVGEVCNIVAGHFKAKIGLEAGCMLSVPLVIRGTDYQIRSARSGEHIDIPLLYEGELLYITLEIHP